MQLFHHGRTLATWSRALLVGFVLAFGLNSVAHASHRHDDATTSGAVHSSACGYCVGFGALADAPSQSLQRFHVDFGTPLVPATKVVLLGLRAPTSAQPRAPPVS